MYLSAISAMKLHVSMPGHSETNNVQNRPTYIAIRKCTMVLIISRRCIRYKECVT
jgi:hypothetical protein